MNHNNDLLTIAGYIGWANRVLYRNVALLPEAEVYRERKMLFGSIVRLLNHCYAMGVVWRSHLTHKSHGFKTRRPADDPTLPDLWQQQQVLDSWFEEYAESINESTVETTLRFNFIGGGEGSMTPREILFHVANHNSYHRGHIEGVFYQLDVEPPTTDFPVFLQSRSL